MTTNFCDAVRSPNLQNVVPVEHQVGVAGVAAEVDRVADQEPEVGLRVRPGGAT